jgi:hypothetical protein
MASAVEAVLEAVSDEVDLDFILISARHYFSMDL